MTHDKEARAWFFHRFYDFQPDLNTSNPYVQAEILKIMGFWIQLGVSGFRMDAVPFVIATKGPKVKTPVEQYDMLRSLREFLQWRQGNAIILAEANVLPETDMEYFGKDGDRMHMMFNFHVNQNLFYAMASADSRPLARALAATKPRPAAPNGGFSCAITTNSISAVSPKPNVTSFSKASVPTRTCSFTIGASGDASLRCSG